MQWGSACFRPNGLLHCPQQKPLSVVTWQFLCAVCESTLSFSPDDNSVDQTRLLCGTVSIASALLDTFGDLALNHAPFQVLLLRVCTRACACAVHACMCRACVDVRACVRACERACVHACMRMYCACMHVPCVRRRVCVRVCVGACVRACVCARVRARACIT